VDLADAQDDEVETLEVLEPISLIHFGRNLQKKTLKRQ
jgi:hypothetical protein